MTSIELTINQPVQAKAPPVPRHGVDTPNLFATIGAVKAQPELANFQFRARCHWVQGTRSRSTMEGFFGAGSEMAHRQPYTAEADHPAVLCGEDHGVTPVEHLLHALASCLTAGIANIAAARGVTLESVEYGRPTQPTQVDRNPSRRPFRLPLRHGDRVQLPHP